MPDSTNPYLTVNAPSYAAPMLDWQKMAQGISGGLTGHPQQVSRPPVMPPQGGQPGQPGQPGQQPNMAQQQMQGLGARLRAMFGGQQSGQPGQPQNIVPQGASPAGPGAVAAPWMPPQGNPGLY